MSEQTNVIDEVEMTEEQREQYRRRMERVRSFPVHRPAQENIEIGAWSTPSVQEMMETDENA